MLSTSKNSKTAARIVGLRHSFVFLFFIYYDKEVRPSLKKRRSS